MTRLPSELAVTSVDGDDERRYRLAVDALRRRIEQLEAVLLPDANDRRPHVARVIGALEQAGDVPMRCRDIAKAARMRTTAVRAILYHYNHRTNFVKSKAPGKLSIWRLSLAYRERTRSGPE